MPDYRKMYFELAAKVAGAIDLLLEAQQQSEEDYMYMDETAQAIPYEETSTNSIDPK